MWRALATTLFFVCVSAILLSAVLAVPYIFTAIGFAAWRTIGMMVTIDDYFVGGWSNPDGMQTMPWGEIGVSAAILAALCLAALSPSVRAWGA